ncbi:MAG: elongation factor P hydroxylase [Porticoccus sp.]|nr:elongation factor P hydroxylase [Porticoccus sp.]
MLSGNDSVGGVDKFRADQLNANQLISLFNGLFADRFNTRLEGGGEEPVYLPADDRCDHCRLVFRRDYVSSALHEISHWCIAGEQRRQVIDFGYWYNPDGRTEVQQRTFEKMEVKPQAIEWIFSVAAGHTFNISADNLSAGIGASEVFVQSVIDQARAWCVFPMPDRASVFTKTLSEIFGTEPYSPAHYHISVV